MNKKTFSRRDFLKTVAAASGGIFAFGYLGAERGVASAQDIVQLTFGRHWEAAFRPVQAEFDANFQEAHPDININITYNTWADHNNVVPAWAAAGTLPDIIYVHGSRVAPWAAEGIIGDIQDLVEPDTEFNVDGIFEESLRLYRVNGNLHGIPYDHGPLILGYNKDMFDAAGIDYPDETWTMDTLKETAIALTDLDAQQWGWSGTLGVDNHWGNAFLGPWGGVTMNDEETEMTIDTPESHEALNFWMSIKNDGGAPSGLISEGFGGIDLVFQNGRAAMHPVPSWATPTLRKFASFDWDVAPWPTGPVGERVTGSFGSGYGVTATSENRDAAWTYLREYLSVEGMITMWSTTGRGSPARLEALEEWYNSDPAPDSAHFYGEAMENYAITGRPYLSLAAPQILDVMVRERDLLRLDETDVASALAAIMAEGQIAMDEAAM